MPVCPAGAPGAGTGAVEGERLTINSINQGVAAGDAAEGRGSCPHPQVLPTVAAFLWEGRATRAGLGGRVLPTQVRAGAVPGAVPSPPSLPDQPILGGRG